MAARPLDCHPTRVGASGRIRARVECSVPIPGQRAGAAPQLATSIQRIPPRSAIAKRLPAPELLGLSGSGERAAESRDEHPNGVDSSGRRGFTPQVIHQAINRHDLIRMQRQNGNHCPLTKATQRDGHAVRADLDRAKDAQIQRRPHDGKR